MGNVMGMEENGSNSTEAVSVPKVDYNVLVTGGAGFIGSHTVLELLNAGYKVAAIDNFSNSKSVDGRALSLERVSHLAGKPIIFRQCDLLDLPALEQLFRDYKFDAVIHFAGLKAVVESMTKPFEYYNVNVVGALNLIQCCRNHGVRTFVFSSSSTVYGNSSELPFREGREVEANITCPYGRTKRTIENILTDISKAEPGWHISILRYFNPTGAHPSGLIGEDPLGVPNNLMPYIAQVAAGHRPHLNIFGGDFPTRDGTAVRDYIHVVDVAKGHISALERLISVSSEKGKKQKKGDGDGEEGKDEKKEEEENSSVVEIFNLGRGEGCSVKEIVAAFEKASGKKIETRVVERRAGDVATNYCDASLANEKLGWKAEKSVDEMCRDMWNWTVKNPNGYQP